jgi:hypothetical protein
MTAFNGINLAFFDKDNVFCSGLSCFLSFAVEVRMKLGYMTRQISSGGQIEFEFSTAFWLITFDVMIAIQPISPYVVFFLINYIFVM